MGITFFRFGRFSSIIVLKIFTGPLIWKSSFSSTPIIRRFGLLIITWISWMFWVRIFLHFAFHFIVVPMFSMQSSAPEILSSVSCILFLMLASIVSDLFHRVSIYKSCLTLFFFCCCCFVWDRDSLSFGPAWNLLCSYADQATLGCLSVCLPLLPSGVEHMNPHTWLF